MADKKLVDKMDDDDENLKSLKEWTSVPGKVADAASSAAGAVGDVASALGKRSADAIRADMDAGIAGDLRVGPDKSHKPAATGDKSEPLSQDDIAALGQPRLTQAADFAPTPTGSGNEPAGPAVSDAPANAAREDFRRAIKGVESAGGDYGAMSPPDKQGRRAYGAYQFRPSYWDGLSQQVTGHKIEDLVPRAGDSREVQDQKKAMQDKLFDAYYDQEIIPGIQKLRKLDPDEKRYSDQDLGALVHFRGLDDAKKLLAGEDADSTLGGTTADKYLHKFRAVMNNRSSDLEDAPPTTLSAGTPPAPPDDEKINLKDLFGKVGGGDDFLSDLTTRKAQIDKVSLDKTADSPSFEEQLQKVESDYRAEKDNIAKRELYHVLADAFTKMGAGLTGMRTGIDMSHVTTPQHDFQKDLELAQSERGASLNDLRARREEQAHQAQFDQQQNFETTKSAYEINLQKMGVGAQVYQAYLSNNRLKAQQAIDKAKTEYEQSYLKFQENKDDTMNRRLLTEAREKFNSAQSARIATIVNSPQAAKNPEGAAASVQEILRNMGVRPDDAKAAVEQSKWFGLSSGPRDPMDMMYEANKMIDSLTPNPLHTAPVTVNYKGTPYHFHSQDAADTFQTKMGMTNGGS